MVSSVCPSWVMMRCMTPPYARPDQPALAQLERLLEALEKELAAWRERCLKAEQDLTQGKGKGHGGPELLQARQGDAEQSARLTGLTERLTRLLPVAKRGGAAKGA